MRLNNRVFLALGCNSEKSTEVTRSGSSHFPFTNQVSSTLGQKQGSYSVETTEDDRREKKKKTLVMYISRPSDDLKKMFRRGDLNSHAARRQHLMLVRLPIPPLQNDYTVAELDLYACILVMINQHVCYRGSHDLVLHVYL